MGPNTHDFAPAFSTACSVWVLLSFLAGLVATIAGFIEFQNYKKKGMSYPQNNYVRRVQRIFAYFLLMITFSGVSSAITSESSSDILYDIFMTIVVGIWFLLAYLYAYCPKQYKKIRFTKYSKPISKRTLSLIIIIITFILIWVAGSITS